MTTRRSFLTLFGGAAAPWPVMAWGQQAAMPVIGFLDPTTPGGYDDYLRPFRQGLKDQGYVEGENVAIVYRYAENQPQRLPELATDLIRRRVNVIATFSTGTFAAKALTSTIPIVFNIAEDPIRRGLVASLARPGGNVTGVNMVSAELVAKRLELFRELVPSAKRVAILVNPIVVSRTETTLRDIQVAAAAMGLETNVYNASSASEINAAFAALARERPDALVVTADAFFTSRRTQLVHLATRYGIPATYSGRQYTDAGGLMSYGSNQADAFRQIGIYVGRILKGAKPAELPVMQLNRFELVINHEAVRMLGLTVPASLLARADEVIE